MRSNKISVAAAMLRMGIVLVLGVIFLAAATVGIQQGTFVNAGIGTITAQGGTAELKKELFREQKPVFLNGEWEYYPSVLQVGERFNSRLLEGKAPQIVQLPLDDVQQATGPATYRLTLKTDTPIQDYCFYLENYNEDFAIYVNGTRIQSAWGGPQEKMLYTMSDYLFYIKDRVAPGEVEIILSANSSKSQTLLYQNAIIFGPASNVVDYEARVWRDDTFLIGMILVMVAVGLIFMLIRVKFDLLSGITMFDTFLAVRILLGFNIATYFMSRMMPWLSIGRVDFVGLQYVAFFITGTSGCLLSQSIFDPEKKLSIWPVRVQTCICIVGALMTLFFYRWLPKLCTTMLFAVLVGSFLIVTWHVIVLLRQKRLTGYYVFQISKTYFIGGVMAADILYLRGEYYNTLIYCYVIFLFAHLITRLIDSNASYDEVEKLNYNLEQRIVERTRELTEANKRLSELSVRDPLTKAYNRLYFEDSMQRVLEKKPEGDIFLCMFDLDYFKTINDRFGHGVGDDQLRFVVQTVNRILDGRGIFARVGGEEFVIFFWEESRETVRTLLESIRRKLEEDAKKNEKRTTASFGVTRLQPEDNAKILLRRADKCLYTAKKLGRNCIVSG